MTLVSGWGMRAVQAIERFTGTPIRREPLPTAEMVAARRADALVAGLRTTIAAGPFPRAAKVVARLVGEGHAPADVAAAILQHLAPPREEPDDAALLPERPRKAPRGGRRSDGPRGFRPAPRRTVGPAAKKRPGKGGKFRPSRRESP